MTRWEHHAIDLSTRGRISSIVELNRYGDYGFRLVAIHNNIAYLVRPGKGEVSTGDIKASQPFTPLELEIVDFLEQS